MCRVVNIVMHYCESGSLASILNSAKKTKTFIAETQVVKWMVQLTLAINYLHENHILHRDLKPMNIMLTEGNVHSLPHRCVVSYLFCYTHFVGGDLIKLADFGLAMDLKDKKTENNLDEAGD